MHGHHAAACACSALLSTLWATPFSCLAWRGKTCHMHMRKHRATACSMLLLCWKERRYQRKHMSENSHHYPISWRRDILTCDTRAPRPHHIRSFAAMLLACTIFSFCSVPAICVQALANTHFCLFVAYTSPWHACTHAFCACMGSVKTHRPFVCLLSGRYIVWPEADLQVWQHACLAGMLYGKMGSGMTWAGKMEGCMRG